MWFNTSQGQSFAGLKFSVHLAGMHEHYREPSKVLSNRFLSAPLLSLQWAAFALVGVLIDSSVVQLLLFCGLHSVLFCILVCLKPFANR